MKWPCSLSDLWPSRARQTRASRMLRDGGVVVREPQRTRWARWHPASKARQAGFVTVGLLTLGFGGRNFKPQNLFKNGEQGVWFDPADWSTLFQDSAGTTPVTAVGQPVGKILDKSGRGNHATQSTAVNRPILQQDSSGFFYLAFNGTNSVMATGNVNFGSAQLTVVAALNVLAGSTAQMFVESSAVSDNNQGSFAAFTYDPPNPRLLTARLHGAQANYAEVQTQLLEANAFDVLTYQYDLSSASANTAGVVRKNSAPQALSAVSGAGGTFPGGGNFGNYPLYIGARGDSSLFFNGRMYGLIVRGAASTPAELTKTERWIGSRMGIAL